MDLRLLHYPSKPLSVLLNHPCSRPPNFSYTRLRRRFHSPPPPSSNLPIKSIIPYYNHRPSSSRGARTSCSFQPPQNNAALEVFDDEEEAEQEDVRIKVQEELGLTTTSDSSGIWKQMKEIALFAGPATGLWICDPLMSLIDTIVIGQSSSLELAALGPGTVFCDNLTYVFMFLSIATSNMVATSLAKKDKDMTQHQISMLLFVAFACGLGMFLFTKLLGIRILTAFTGSENSHLIPAANTYVQGMKKLWSSLASTN